MTKEEILRATFTTVEYPDAVQRTEIYKAMDTYAEQRLKEYKEKLRLKVDEQQHMLLVTKDTFKDLIDEV